LPMALNPIKINPNQAELEENIREAYQLLLEEDEISHHPGSPLFPATLKSKKASVI
jgi:hypothetical protein